MASELLPCPFCGGTDLSSGGDDKFVGYCCKTCQATGPNHYGSSDWNTRTAPAATDTGLVTRAWLHPAAGWAHASEGEIIPHCLKGHSPIPLVTRSQAEELLAAITKERDHWKEYSSGQGKLIESGVFVTNDEYVRLTALEADNAAKDKRIEFLLRHAVRRAGKFKALEDKLAAAEKSLEPFAAVLEDYDPDWEDDDVTAVLVVGSVTHYGITLGDFRKARAVLGGKPS